MWISSHPSVGAGVVVVVVRLVVAVVDFVVVVVDLVVVVVDLVVVVVDLVVVVVVDLVVVVVLGVVGSTVGCGGQGQVPKSGFSGPLTHPEQLGEGTAHCTLHTIYGTL